MDTMDLEILEDGTVSITTDKISDANHAKADELLKELEEMLGGAKTTKKNPKAKRHSHKHVHAH